MMYYCSGCNHSFEEDDLATNSWTESNGETIYYGKCPFCHSEEIEPAGRCKGCGTDIPLTKDYCDICKESIDELMSETTRKLSNVFDSDRETVLDAIGDWLERQ